MFKLDKLRFYHGNDSQEYKFSNNTYVYGKNTRGKTALTKVIDFVLGSSEDLTYQGLDNIDAVEAIIKNEFTILWIKRNVGTNDFFYKRTEESDYSKVSREIYNDNIELVINQNRENKYIDVYKKVFEETPSFRTFNFINYIEEKGLGDLSIVFTCARDLKYSIRIKPIMNFLFNYENIERIYEKQVILESKTKELNDLESAYNEYSANKDQQIELFRELQLKYQNNYQSDLKTFNDFKDSYMRKSRDKNKDLVYLSKASFSLAEEIKIYEFMKNQSQNMIERKERIKRFLTILKGVIDGSPQYEEYLKFIVETTETIDNENIILSLTDYNKAIKKVQKEKDELDAQINELKGLTYEISYEDALKKVGQLEHIFDVIKNEINIKKYQELQNEVKILKNEIKEMRDSYNKEKVNEFNIKLTDSYLNKDLNIKHVKDDFNEKEFSLEFDPFKICLYARHKDNDNLVAFLPGSMARQTHIQMLVYLMMFVYLKENFKGFPYLPLLFIDSADQSFGKESFEELYPILINLANSSGIQTIFLSKDKVKDIKNEDLIDISNGLNKFHKQ